MKTLFVLYLSIMSLIGSFAQPDEEKYSLEFSPDNTQIEYKIKLDMCESNYLLYEQNKLDSVCCDRFKINQREYELKEIEFRGNSSRKYARKSFNVKLKHKIELKKQGMPKRLKQFCLISMNMDQNYYRNRISYDILSKLGLWDLFYTYVEVEINNESQGIYLLVQRPQRYILKEENSQASIRRNDNSEFEKAKLSKDSGKNKKYYKNKIDQLYAGIEKKEGRKLESFLRKHLDLDQYMSWMAFNYLVGNDEVPNEVFFYPVNIGKREVFRILPWDFDNVLRNEKPKNITTSLRPKNIKNLDPLDAIINSDPHLYQLFEDKLIELTVYLSDETIRHLFETAYHDLYPFYKNLDIRSISRKDYYGSAGMMDLMKDMNENYNFVLRQKRKIEASLIKK